ncbi:MAG: radical SAM protein [Bacteroidales bacterium]|nr:radical SAM protein [Bacteroidales bacterium]MCF8403867.1 radical SAM protein [Bacteroidales bacterium]
MFFTPLKYEEPLFRPPSEAYSLILQATIGCSWNKCAFCEMYSSKKFRVKPLAELKEEIKLSAEYFPETRKIFIADGNAMALQFTFLKEILNSLKDHFPKLTRVTAYAGSRDMEEKSLNELQKLNLLGLKMVYVGIESGDEEVLRMVNKGETNESVCRNLKKAKDAGIKLSVMILTGLGGKHFTDQHAIQSANLINRIQPDFLSTLVLSFPYGPDHYKKRFKGEFIEMEQIDILKELRTFISYTELNSSIFRSDHASNYLILKGILGRDKNDFLKKLDFAIKDPGKAGLRDEWRRGL